MRIVEKSLVEVVVETLEERGISITPEELAVCISLLKKALEVGA